MFFAGLHSTQEIFAFVLSTVPYGTWFLGPVSEIATGLGTMSVGNWILIN